jgi:hypothetical protein
MSDAATTAAINLHAQSDEPTVLFQWLCVDGEFLLPCQQDNLDGRLLSGRPSARRTK